MVLQLKNIKRREIYMVWGLHIFTQEASKNILTTKKSPLANSTIFLGYKAGLLFQYNLKDQDPSFKINLDL